MAKNDSGKWKADAEAIRALRIKRKLTLPAAAALIGDDVHFKSLANIERGARGASEIMLLRIAQAYGVKPDQLRKKAAA